MRNHYYWTVRTRIGRAWPGMHTRLIVSRGYREWHKAYTSANYRAIVHDPLPKPRILRDHWRKAAQRMAWKLEHYLFKQIF